MRLVKPCIQIPKEDWDMKIKKLERYGRVCYKSEDKLEKDGDVNNPFIRMLVDRKHESVLEHEKVTFLLVADRGVTHELVRHRMASYSQESTRYCNYGKDKFGNEVTFIRPNFFTEEELGVWVDTMAVIEENYFKLLNLGATPQEARSILPNSLKTEIAVTMNMRSLRNFLKQRCAVSAHPQIKEVAIPFLLYLKEKAAPIFADIPYDEGFNKEWYGDIIETNAFFEEE